jgi:hypothetical protein
VGEVEIMVFKLGPVQCLLNVVMEFGHRSCRRLENQQHLLNDLMEFGLRMCRCLENIQTKLGLKGCMILEKLVNKLGLRTCTEIYMDQFGLRTCTVICVDKLGLSRFLVNYVDAIGPLLSMEDFMGAVGLRWMELKWDYIITVLKNLATFRVMVRGEVDLEMEGRVVHLHPGLRTWAPP